MIAITGHFDGKVIVPDEPVDLPKDRPLLLHVEEVERQARTGKRWLGQFKGQLHISEDFDAPLEDFKDYT